MRTALVYLVPACFLPGGLAFMASPTPDGAGLEVYINELIPKGLRAACVDAATAADPDSPRVLHLTS